VRAVHVVRGRVGPHGEERMRRRVQVIEQPGVGRGKLDAGPPAESRTANQGELGAEQPGGGQPRRVSDGGLAVLRQPHRVGLGHEQDVAFIGGPEREESLRPVEHLQHRLRPVVVRHALHHVDHAGPGHPLGLQQVRWEGSTRQGEVGHGRILNTSRTNV